MATIAATATTANIAATHTAAVIVAMATMAGLMAVEHRTAAANIMTAERTVVEHPMVANIMAATMSISNQ
jgi:hypothetical protein